MAFSFHQNDAFSYGIIVENFGNGSLTFNSTCWVENRAYGNGLVASYGTEVPNVTNDYGSKNEVEYLSALECEFVALVDGNDQSFPNLACADFSADTCSFSLELPTPPPVESVETVEPSAAPAGGTTPTAAQGSAGPAVTPTEAMPIKVPTSSASVVRLVSGIMAMTMVVIAIMLT